MLYVEKRVNSLKALALHRHISTCENCRDLFLLMDATSGQEIEIGEEMVAPEGFDEAVMAKIYALPAHKQETEIGQPDQPTIDWMRVAGCLYALLLAAGLVVLYNTELVELPYLFTTSSTTEWVDAFFGILAQAGQAFVLFMANMAGDFANFILIIAFALWLIAIGIYGREKTKV